MSPALATHADNPDERYRTRLTGALVFSLLVHGLILSLQFGIPGVGLPTLELPWRERRAQAVDLHVVLGGAPRAPEPAAEEAPAIAASPQPQTSPESRGLTLYTPPAPPAREKRKPRKAKEPPASIAPTAPPPVKRKEPVIALPAPRSGEFVVPPSTQDDVPPAEAPPERVADQIETPPATGASTALQESETERLRLELEAKQREEIAQREALALEARKRNEEETRKQAAEAERLALEQEARRRDEAIRQEQAQAERLALELEASRRAEEKARQQAALALQQQREQEEAARRALELEAKRREEAQRIEREAMELQARKQAEEAERQRQAALERQRQAEESAARQKAEADAAARRREAELAAAEKARADASLPRDNAGGSLASRALEQARRSDIFRNDGPTASRPVESNNSAERRGSILGRVSQDVGLMMYVESWRLKIERNGNLNYQQSSVDKARGDPVVTVAIRSDGSVEDVVIHRSSGRAELDEAVRRIVRLNARYSAFPPELARRFDVIEIRRIWSFDERLRILEEVR